MAGVRIRRRGVEFRIDISDVLKGGPVAGSVRGLAGEIAQRARASAPVDTGAYRDSIRVVDDPTGERARSRVVASVPYATLVESRTGNLRRAAGG